MRSKAAKWAWRQPVKPSSKLLLMALVEFADKEGTCWPGQERLAAMCSVSVRQVRNLARELEEAGLILITTRPGNGSGRKSNFYQLCIERQPETGFPLQGGQPEISDRATGNAVPGNRKPISSELPEELPVEVIPPPLSSKYAEKSGGGDFDEQVLVYPPGLSETEQLLADDLVGPLNEKAQDLLDELAGLINAGRIRVSPISCLRGMVKRAGEGRFTLDAGQKIKAARVRQRNSQEDTCPKVSTADVLREHQQMRVRMQRRAGQV